MAAVELNNASVKYGRNQALKSANLKVKANTLFALCGPSGSGKTSVILAILGQVKLGKGSVVIFDSKSMQNVQIPGQNVGTVTITP